MMIMYVSVFWGSTKTNKNNKVESKSKYKISTLLVDVIGFFLLSVLHKLN